MSYFVIPARGPDYDAVRAGIGWVIRQASGGEASIAVYGTSQVEILAKILGAPAIAKRREFTFDGTSVKILIKKDFTRFGRLSGPVLAVWLSDDMLAKLDDMKPTSMCVVPWLDTDIRQWKRTRNPVNLRSGERDEDPPALNPVVAEALKHVSFNVGTGIVHPQDKGRAVQTFRALRKWGESWDADDVRAWAINNGWDARHADDLASVAERIGEGRVVQAPGSSTIPKKAVDEWRRRAADSDR